MKVLPLSEVKTKLSELVDVVERRDESITITRNGRPDQSANPSMKIGRAHV